jgi:uncharacterized membrane protein YjjP (DUF1212 family)
MLQNGAETELVERTVHRLGTALGCDWMDIYVAANAIVLTTVSGKRFVTKTRRVVDRGINIDTVVRVEQLCMLAERGVLEHRDVSRRLRLISEQPVRYNRWLVVAMVGLACASFSRLFGGDWPAFVMTFVAASCGMLLRQELGHRHLNPLFIFGATAFVTTTIAGFAARLEWSAQPEAAMSACVLLLVPGFPFVNAISDGVKGHIQTGWARWLIATLLVISATVGIILGMNVSGVWSWLS